jgi:diguanylate cyclase (GGDEF)-like protein
MKLDKLRMIRHELESEFARDGVSSSIFYFFPDKWNRLDDQNVVPLNIANCLDGSKSEAIAFHETSSRFAWFACEESRFVVALEFPSSPQLAKRKRARARIENVLERASNAYRVAHNPLTLLLARDAFRTRVETAIDSLPPSRTEDGAEEGVKQQSLVALFALDIDYFKQINDSHGHLYGDQVLKTFALRLEKVARSLTATLSSKTEIALGHPSGEEFLVLVRGDLTNDQVGEIADAFRKAIESDRLPNEAEWSQLKDQENLSVLLPPPLQERIVQASVGIAIHRPPSSEESLKDQVARLIDQADTALYRAKAAGRNQVISFDNILANCGRVLEQDNGTRIVAIDIGKNVGVTVGQEFRVFPPGFTGKKKFSVNDGRTTRTIGTYPRFEIARITVFDVQPELSFAFISNQDSANVVVEVGSHLEAIPIGSIGHLLPHGTKYFSGAADGVRVGDIAPLHEFVAQSAATEAQIFAVVFRFSRADQFLKQYGPAPLNSALARLYRAVSATFHSVAAIGILDSASICVVGKAGNYDEERITDFVNELAEELAELQLVAGVFSQDDLNRKLDAGYAELKAEHAIEFAVFAASEHAITAESRIAHFHYDTATRILSSLREAGATSQGQADFDKLQALGVVSPSLLNFGGLAHFAEGNFRKATELWEQATRLSDLLVFKTNYATGADALGEVDRPLRVLSKISDRDFARLAKFHPFGFVSYARLLARAKLANSPLFDARRFETMALEAYNMEGFKGSSASEVIMRALQPESLL